LDALCGVLPDAARRELSFLDKRFRAKAPAGAWRGWLAGYAVSGDGRRATNGMDFEVVSAEGRRPEGSARIGEDADLSRAVLSCAEATPAQKAYALKAVDHAWIEFGKRALARDPRLLLDDAVSLGAALLAAERPEQALSMWRWMDQKLAAGPAFLDRDATGVLPPDMDRLAVPALNARALSLMRGLMRDLSGACRRQGVPRREKELYSWLSARSDSLDPAVWAALAAKETR
jgi:hypothetical protein